MLQSVYTRRLKRIKKELSSGKGPEVLLVSSADPMPRSRNHFHPFRQDSNFFYLTGLIQKDLALVISATSDSPIIISKKKPRELIVWEGKPRDIKKAASLLGADFIETDNPEKEIINLLRRHETLHYQSAPATPGFRIARKIFSTPSYERSGLPWLFSDLDNLLTPFRLFKDSHEISEIKKAIEFTFQAKKAVLSRLGSFKSEYDLKCELEAEFLKRGCMTAFPSIVAAGKSGATLHYEHHDRPLKSGQTILIDCGAELNCYSADITRVYPVNGKFSETQKIVYQTVLSAQEAALATIRDGVLIKKVYDAAAEELLKGLVELKVLKGSVKKLMKEQAYKPYFPHGIGHSLGLDTHDLGNLRGNNEARLKKGMVFTVEPGLYFSRPVGKAPSLGVRIEDDVLVTQTGCQILSRQIPKEVQEVEALVGG